MTPELLARIPVDPRYPLDALRTPFKGCSMLQRAWLGHHSSKFTVGELGIIFRKEWQTMRVYCNRHGFAVKPNPHDKAPKREYVRAHVVHEQRRVKPDPVIEDELPRAEGQRRHVAAMSLRTDSMQVEQRDVDLGWWLNNAILHKMGIRKLGPDGCSWIDGDPHEPAWKYCGARRLRGSSYCESHQRRAWQAKPKEETDNG